jgi:hypothetical protein
MMTNKVNAFFEGFLATGLSGLRAAEMRFDGQLAGMGAVGAATAGCANGCASDKKPARLSASDGMMDG